MKTFGSTLVLAVALGASGCILLLDTEKLHSDSGGAAGTSAAAAGGASAGASGAAGDAGKAGKAGKGTGGSGGMATGGAGGAAGAANPVCLMCLGNKCAKEIGVCELKPMCKACLADSTKAGCAMDSDYLAVIGCLCLNCAVDCAVNCGAAGKGGG